MILNEVLLYMSDVYLHDCSYIKATPLEHPFAYFSLLSRIRFLSLTNFRLLSLITMSASKKRKPEGTGTHSCACNCSNSKPTHPDQCNLSATLFCILQKVVSVHNVEGTNN